FKKADSPVPFHGPYGDNRFWPKVPNFEYPFLSFKERQHSSRNRGEKLRGSGNYKISLNKMPGKKSRNGKTDIIQDALYKSFVGGNITPYSYDCNTINNFFLVKFVFITGVHFPLRKIRCTGNHGNFYAIFYPFLTMFVSPVCRGIHFGRKIVR